MKKGVILIFCYLSSASSWIHADVPLKAYYQSVERKGIVYYNFVIEKTTDETIMISHLNNSKFIWQATLPNGVQKHFFRNLPTTSTPGYAFMSKSKVEFSLRSDRNIITLTAGNGGENYLAVRSCRLSEFQAKGLRALATVKIPLYPMPVESKP